jgi:Holliday junction resolvase RusA-like endonuclease
MKIIWSKRYDNRQFSTYIDSWRNQLSQDAKAEIPNWPPTNGKYRMEAKVFYRPGNAGLENSDVDNLAKVVLDGTFCTSGSGTGADRFVYELNIEKAENKYDGLEIKLIDLLS